MQRKPHGFTLIEIGIVLLIAAAIVFAAVRLGGSKNSESAGNTETVLISDLITTTKKVVQAGATLSTTSDFITAKVFPSAWPVTGSGASATVNNSFGGSVTATVSANLATLTTNSIVSATCLSMVPSLANNQAVDSVSIAGLTPMVKPSGGTFNYQTMVTQCNSSSTVPIAITFKIR